MNGAILHYEPIFSKWDQGIFYNQTLKRIKREIKIDDFYVPLYLLPVYGENPSEKAVRRFFQYLKEEKVDKLFLTEDAKKLPIIKMTEKYFSVYNGKCMINYYINDILKKCSEEKKILLKESKLVFVSDDPEEIKELLTLCCSSVKEICIDTKYPDKFDDLRKYILENYGIYISFLSKREKKDIIFSWKRENKAYDFSFHSDNSTQVIFYHEQLSKKILPIIECNQSFVEFMIEKKFNSLKKPYIRRFLTDYPLRIVKIKNND